MSKINDDPSIFGIVYGQARSFLANISLLLAYLLFVMFVLFFPAPTSLLFWSYSTAPNFVIWAFVAAMQLSPLAHRIFDSLAGPKFPILSGELI